MRILSHLFSFPLEEQTLDAAIGMHGAGGLGAQCGLVEGSLMFIGAYLAGSAVVSDPFAVMTSAPAASGKTTRRTDAKDSPSR